MRTNQADTPKIHITGQQTAVESADPLVGTVPSLPANPLEHERLMFCHDSHLAAQNALATAEATYAFTERDALHRQAIGHLLAIVEQLPHLSPGDNQSVSTVDESIQGAGSATVLSQLTNVRALGSVYRSARRMATTGSTYSENKAFQDLIASLQPQHFMPKKSFVTPPDSEPTRRIALMEVVAELMLNLDSFPAKRQHKILTVAGAMYMHIVPAYVDRLDKVIRDKGISPESYVLFRPYRHQGISGELDHKKVKS